MSYDNDQLRWLPPAAEECDSGSWLVWWTECRRYRVARFASRYEPRVVYTAGLGMDVKLGEYPTLARAIAKCEDRHCQMFNLTGVLTNGRKVVEQHSVDFPGQGVDARSRREHNVDVAGNSPFSREGNKMFVSKKVAVGLLLTLKFMNVKKEIAATPEVVLSRLKNMEAIYDPNDDETQVTDPDQKQLLDALLARKQDEDVEFEDDRAIATIKKGTAVTTATKNKGTKAAAKAAGSPKAATKAKGGAKAATATKKATAGHTGNGKAAANGTIERDFLGARLGSNVAAVNKVLKDAKKPLTLVEIVEKADVSPNGIWHHLKRQVEKGTVAQEGEGRNPTYALAK